jgi:DNA-binding transcriptional ArsR family regulator
MPIRSSADAKHDPLPEGALDQIAGFFQVLSEPTRLHLLRLLRDGERSVGELAEALNTSPANASRHLAMLDQQGLVVRESRGNSVVCRVADQSVYELCELVCGKLVNRLDVLQAKQAAFAPGPITRRRGAVPKRRN